MLQTFSSSKYHKEISKDDSYIPPYRKLSSKINHPKRSKKFRSWNTKKINNFRKYYFDSFNDNFINDSNDKDSIDDTDHSSKSQKSKNKTKISSKNYHSHSSSSLINIKEIKDPNENHKTNISDDESEKINSELKKANTKFLEQLKKNNIDFSNNMKNIFNNIGNITPFKSEKNSEDNKEESELSLKCYEKSENIRKVYYSKLLLKRVWIPLNDSQRHNNLIIFDWDDTLLPTSFLVSKNMIDKDKKLNEKDQGKLNKLEILVKNLLTLTLSKGEVYIITNAGEGWVEESATNYYPNLKEILDKIEVISARKDYEKKYPENTKLWKIRAFLTLKSRVNEELITNMVCLGDSVFEMEAGKILASSFIHAVIKTIKFMENPKPEELIKQLNLVLNQFNSIFSSSKNLTVRVEKKRK